jgi:hypothetical protein
MAADLPTALLIRIFSTFLPITIVTALAICMALYYREEWPWVGLLTAISFLLLFVSSAILPSLVLSPVGPHKFYTGSLSAADILHRSGLVRGTLGIAAIILLQVAIFGWRQGRDQNR